MRHMLLRLAFLLTVAVLAVGVAPRRAAADLEVSVRVDKVTLKDGTEVECIVLMVTAKGVLIVESDPKEPEKTRQRVIPAEQVESIVHGERDGAVTGLQTETEETQKVVQGTGFRKPSKTKKDAKEGKDAKDGGTPKPPGVIQGLKADKVTTVKIDDPKGPVPASKLAARDLSDAYLSRFPVLKSSAQNLLGLDRVPQLIEQAQKGDPLARKQVESFLKMFLPADTTSLAEKPVAAQAKPKPPRNTRREPPPSPAPKAPAK